MKKSILIRIGSVIAFIFIILLIFLIKENIKNDSKRDNNRYVVENKEIFIEGIGFNIPQIQNMKDKRKQNKLNKIITNEIKNYFLSKTALDNSTGIFSFESSVETKNNNKLSLLFTYDLQVESAAHPTVSAFAVNLDLNKEDIVELDNVKKKIMSFDMNKFSHTVKRERALNSDGGVLENKDMKNLFEEMDRNSFYFINDGIGIIFEVPYVCGGYSIYEERS